MDLLELEDGKPEGNWYYEAKLRILRRTADKFRSNDADTLLDIGAGSGFFAAELSKSIPITDPCLVDLNYVQAYSVEDLGGLRLHRYQSAQTISGQTFSIVLMNDVLEHVVDDESLLKQGLTLLSDGGVLIITVPAHPFMWSSHDERLLHYRRYTKTALDGLISRAGATKLELRFFFNALLVPAYVVRVLLPKLTRFSRAGSVGLPKPLEAILFRLALIGSKSRRGLPFGLSLLAVLTK